MCIILVNFPVLLKFVESTLWEKEALPCLKTTCPEAGWTLSPQQKGRETGKSLRTSRKWTVSKQGCYFYPIVQKCLQWNHQAESSAWEGNPWRRQKGPSVQTALSQAGPHAASTSAVSFCCIGSAAFSPCSQWASRLTPAGRVGPWTVRARCLLLLCTDAHLFSYLLLVIA